MHHTYYKYGVRLPLIVVDWRTMVQLFLRCSGKYRLHVRNLGVTSNIKISKIQCAITNYRSLGYIWRLRTAV
ncbi:hypothetical protein CY34DRAFT_375234 [Suillus luteus UH-Slu-Lm8-n1]|uniref:Uncharacterized protein n=1 Tax=Suillus luteus UH-Slu-Lm8-n1 TaxID=930992 RepID=A0A0D0AWE8_9AGAM|nr:hypothetical protein CY34DRAFT_375234 [Suillus luteus UH-Slu-Lm8-n1]